MKFKNIISYLAVAVVMCFVVSAAVYSGTITKGKWTKSDMALWTGTSSTEYERETSTGYNLILPYFDYIGVDVLEVYGGNVNANDTTLQLALDAIETTNERLIWMSPTTWSIDDDVTIPANVTMQIPPGCTLAIANTKDLYFTEDGRQIQAGNYQIFDTSAGGTVTIASAIMEHDMWRDGSGLDWYPSSDAAMEFGSETYKIKHTYTHKISGQPFPGFLQRPKFTYVESLDYTSGGPHELVVGDTVEGETGGGTGYVAHITLTSGTWAAGTAAGVLYLHTRNATAFEAETLKDNGNLDCASIAAASVKNAILISPFVYYHCGTTEQLLYSDSNIPFEFANLGTSDWSYLYFDDSAIVTAATNLISATELVDSVTEPEEVEAKHGWHHPTTVTNDKCFFAVITDGSGNIIEFFHDGGDYVQYANAEQELSAGIISNTFTDVDCAPSIPSFSQKADIHAACVYVDVAASLKHRVNGQTGAIGHIITVVNTGVTNNTGSATLYTDSAQIFEIAYSGAGTNTVSIYVNGWYFPNGM